MMMIDKVKKYLLRHSEISFYKKNESGSEYYKVGESIIRVSNHITTANNYPDTLNIVVGDNNFIVFYGNRLINVNNYEEFKKFLKYHIQMCDCFKDLINKGLNRGATYVERIVEDPQPQMQIVRAKPANHKVSQFIFYKGERIDVSDLSEKQYKGLVSMQNHGCFKSRDTLDKQIQLMRATL